MKIQKLTVNFESGMKYSHISRTLSRSELYIFATEQWGNEIEDATSITVEEMKNPDILLSSRAKKTHAVDETGLKTVCGEIIDYEKAYLSGTRFRCEKCGN